LVAPPSALSVEVRHEEGGTRRMVRAHRRENVRSTHLRIRVRAI